MLPWILAGFAGLSALTAASSVVLLRNKWRIDNATLKKMDADRRTDEDEREQKRRTEEEERAADRRREDERRYQLQRDEMNKLATLANDRFVQWQDAIADLDEVWQYVEDHVPWDREAYAKLRELNIEISRPPLLGRRHSHRDGDGAGQQAR